MLMDEGERMALVTDVVEIPMHRALGVRLIETARPAAGVEIDVNEMTTNPSGSLHGGVVALLLDVACFLAVLDGLEAGTHAVTVNINVSLLSAVPGGETVRFRADVERRGRSLVFLSARALHGERIVATAQVVKSIVASA